VPDAPVSSPPARPNPLGEVLSLVDVEARVTGISLPWTPEAPMTGVAAVDRERSAPDGDRPGRRVWNASRDRAEATWSDGRRRGHETWEHFRGD
jgi:hypothetical protein